MKRSPVKTVPLIPNAVVAALGTNTEAAGAGAAEAEEAAEAVVRKKVGSRRFVRCSGQGARSITKTRRSMMSPTMGTRNSTKNAPESSPTII